jgi:hypothetical protein
MFYTAMKIAIINSWMADVQNAFGMEMFLNTYEREKIKTNRCNSAPAP